MILNVYSIRDVKTGFLSPLFEMSDSVAVRNFEHAISTASVDNLFFSHPSDYSFYALGTFDTESGRIVSFDVPVHLMDATEVTANV